MSTINPINVTMPFTATDFLNPMRKYDSVFLPVDEWKPSDWQIYAGTHLYHGHYLGGFFSGGVHVDGLADNGDGTYTLSAGGLSTAKGKTPFEFGVHYTRKRVDSEKPGVFHSFGPSFNAGFTFQQMSFTDYAWLLVLDDSQLREALGSAYDGAINSLGEEFPDPNSIATYEDALNYLGALSDWANSTQSGLSGIDDIIKSAFSDYDIGQDYEGITDKSSAYPVQTCRFDADLCLEQSVWDYTRRFNFLNSGRICLRGSAMIFSHPDFENKMFLGIGPHAEWDLLSYHHKPVQPSAHKDEPNLDFVPPVFTISLFAYADAQYFNGFDFQDGFSKQNRFVTGSLGLGIRGTLPSFRRYRDPAQHRRDVADAFRSLPDRAPFVDMNDIPF
ncbi:MAG: hypothetical protein ABII18_03785 [bacterium]